MAAQRYAYSTLLASPPALRSEIFRQAFRSSVSLKPGALYQAGRIGTAGLHIYPRRLAQRGQADSYPGIPHTRAIEPEERLEKALSGTFTSPTSTAELPRPRRLRRFLLTSSLFLVFLSAGFAMAAAPAAETINGFVNPPTDAETLTLFEPPTPTAAEINERIITHPLAVKLRAQAGMTESRPHLKIPPAMRPHNLTGGTLLGEGKIEVPPLTFNDKDAELPQLVQLAYLGPALCGHPGIVHGGLLATMLDEGLARACFPALPNKVGVTASLKIDYKVPCPANSYVVLKAQTTKVEGRKAWVTGWIELLGEGDGEGTKLVTAEALFIEPKNAAGMARVYSTQ